jgi:hypothetical protein
LIITVSRLEEEQQLVDATKKLIQLYQGKIKEKIDEVWGERMGIESTRRGLIINRYNMLDTI